MEIAVTHVEPYDQVKYNDFHDDCANTKCNRPRYEFPMAFRREPYCSDNCRKELGMDLPKLDARH